MAPVKHVKLAKAMYIGKNVITLAELATIMMNTKVFHGNTMKSWSHG